MAKVKFKVTSDKAFSRVAKSDHLASQLEAVAAPVLAAARQDPNKYYVSSLRMRRFRSRGRAGRVSIQIGAAPAIGGRVEAKRGTLARAMGLLGL